MIEDVEIEGLDDSLQDPGEGAKKAGEEIEETVDDGSEEAEVDKTENNDEETEDESVEDKDDELTLQDKHDYLKSEVGRMANRVKDLTVKLENQATPPVEAVADPLDAKIEAAKKLYGPEFVELVDAMAARRVAPLQEAQGKQLLRERYKDFDELQPEMDKIFADSPTLRKAAETDITVLDTVHAAAKLKKGEAGTSEQAQKDEARRKKVDSLKADAHVEKPSGKASAPRKATPKEMNDGFIGDLIGSLSNNPE